MPVLLRSRLLLLQPDNDVGADPRSGQFAPVAGGDIRAVLRLTVGGAVPLDRERSRGSLQVEVEASGSGGARLSHLSVSRGMRVIDEEFSPFTAHEPWRLRILAAIGVLGQAV